MYVYKYIYILEWLYGLTSILASEAQKAETVLSAVKYI